MAFPSYEQLIPVGSLMIITSISFILGVLYSNWPYDHFTLWNATGGVEGFQSALEHYKKWGEAPIFIIHTMHGVLVVGFIGCFIKIFKPEPEVQYFEYGTLLVLVAATCIYLSNVRTGVVSAVVGEWGDVSQDQGVAVIGASIVMIVILLLGVLLLQCGLYYAQVEDMKVKNDFYLAELKEQLATTASKPAPATTTSKASGSGSGSETKTTKASKVTKKKNIKQFIRHGRQAHPTPSAQVDEEMQYKIPSDSEFSGTEQTLTADSSSTTQSTQQPNNNEGHYTKRHHRIDEYSKLASDMVREENEYKQKQQQKQAVTRYSLLEKLGEGAFSTVYKAKDLETNQFVAIKLIKKYELDQAQQASVLKEVNIMRQLKHPNIVEFLNFIETEEYYYIVQEVVEGGEIFNEVVKYTYFSEDLARHVLVQLARGIEYLHEVVGVVHRDIKPENIFFNQIQFLPYSGDPSKRLRKSDDPNTKLDEGEFVPNVGAGGIGTIKIGDFGLSKQITVSNNSLATPCGTIGYTAPEIVKDMKYSKEVDLWAIGCVLYILLCGFPPFFNDQIEVLTRKVAKGEFDFLSPWWDEISMGAKRCVAKLLVVNPIERYTIKDLFNDPWVKEFTDRCERVEQDQHAMRVSSVASPSNSLSSLSSAATKKVSNLNFASTPSSIESSNAPQQYYHSQEFNAPVSESSRHGSNHHRQPPGIPSSGAIPSHVVKQYPALYSPAAIAMREAFDISAAVHRMGEEAAYGNNYSTNQGQPIGGRANQLASLNEDEEMEDSHNSYQQSIPNMVYDGDINGVGVVETGTTPFQLNLGTATILGRRKKKGAVPAF
ncbi:hypothetical protein CANARDRAFT_8355 [[Candida] arabinofermentans NRRL YB-2248]|uniref:Protein kinase domain-containing protein n=1 Tax=[Candida] arabinofermentans NRRL YB-2248 TaxID=983967 RepID=A0A1E4SZ91_9ASCO|nr:hypothetical protein CANARDRAFT_8355 [[Candida] arabinofermentans NRRL YB-2248]